MERFDEVKSKVMTVQEVSSYLRVHPSTIYRMLKRHQLPAFRVGSDWRFTIDAIDRWREKVESGSVEAAENHKAVQQETHGASK
jgi:excisionase family DNA binding protein